MTPNISAALRAAHTLPLCRLHLLVLPCACPSSSESRNLHGHVHSVQHHADHPWYSLIIKHQCSNLGITMFSARHHPLTHMCTGTGTLSTPLCSTVSALSLSLSLSLCSSALDLAVRTTTSDTDPSREMTQNQQVLVTSSDLQPPANCPRPRTEAVSAASLE